MKPYAQIDGITIYNCRLDDVLEQLPQVDAIITDPPYAETSLEWDVWVDGWPRLLKDKSQCLWSFGSFRMFLDRKDEFKDWTLAQEIVWEKHNGSGFCGDRFNRVHELAVQWYQGKWSDIHKEPVRVQGGSGNKHIPTRGKTPHRGDIAPSAYKDDGKRYVRSVIPVRSCHGEADNETQKPEGIIAPLMSYSVPEGGIVLDAFCGSGPVGTVARRQGKRAILIDMRECQCEAAARRLQQQELSLDGH